MLKTFVRNQVQRLGYDVRQSRPVNSIAAFLSLHQIDLVFDVGANAGQYGMEMIRSGYRGSIHSFEPNPEPFAKLQKMAADYPLWTLHNAGLGAAEGELQLNISELDVFSSFLPTTDEAAAFDSRSSAVRKVAVPVHRLDSYDSFAKGKRTYIKIDTQGFEREVLAGGGAALRDAIGVQLELSMVPFYEKVWSIEEAFAQMRLYGFVPAQFHTVNVMVKDPASAIEVDCVFRRI